MTLPRDCSHFHFHSIYPFSADQVHAWHARPGALQRLLPPWQDIEILKNPGSIEPGSLVHMRLKLGPFSKKFIACHTHNIPGIMFRDSQQSGPFRHWQHNHFFDEVSSGCLLRDEVEYALPLHDLLPGFLKKKVDKQLQRTFRYREAVLQNDLSLHDRYSNRSLRILVTGASGVLGRQLVPFLTTGGHSIWTLVRRKPDRRKNELFWDPMRGEMERDLPELDAVIHLAGEYIGLNRWTESQKQRVKQSRIRGTELLARTLADQPQPPHSLLCASAVGYYGHCGDVPVSEEHSAGKDFISEVCQDWETATTVAKDAGIRTVLMRLGVGLTPAGGALERILRSSRAGCIRCCGLGTQYVSWISLNDMIGAILHLLTQENIAGPVNIAAPVPVTNAELMATVARVTGRPLLLPIPASLLLLLYGQMAQEILLSGCRVNIDKLVESGYSFRHQTLETALREMLGRPDQAQIQTVEGENKP